MSRRFGTSIALEPATTKGCSCPSIPGPRIHPSNHPRVSGANEQRREKTGRSIARTAGREDKRSAQQQTREATSCRDREQPRRKSRCSRLKLRLQSSRTRDLSKGLESKSKDVPGRGSPVAFTSGEGETILVEVERTSRNFCAGGARSRRRDVRGGVRRATRSVGRQRPPTRRTHIDRSTHGAVKRRPTWLVTPQKRHVLQEPHDMQAARSTARWA
jgi:hypothetical protein